MGFETLAASTWAAMWAIYDRRYGKWGEARVRALQKQIIRQQRAIDVLTATIAAQSELVALLQFDLDRADADAADRTARISELVARLNVCEVRAEQQPMPDITGTGYIASVAAGELKLPRSNGSIITVVSDAPPGHVSVTVPLDGETIYEVTGSSEPEVPK